MNSLCDSLDDSEENVMTIVLIEGRHKECIYYDEKRKRGKW